MKRTWATVLAFLLVVGVLASAQVLASILATFVGGMVTIVASDGTGTLWLYVDSDDRRITEWNPIGTRPYLDAIDYDDNPNDNYIYTSTKNQIDGDYYFTDTGKTTETITNVTVQIYARNSDSANLDIYVWNSSSYAFLGTQGLTPSWQWVNYTATTILDTWTKIDGAKIYVESLTDGGPYEIDCARLQVEYNATS